MSNVSDSQWLPRIVLRWLWRRREQPSEIASGDTFGSPLYKYGKVGGSLRIVSETGETPYVCCGYCSAHMACMTAKTGLSDSMREEAHEIRSTGGRPHNSGSNPTELRNGAKNALGITLSAVAVDEIPDRLRAGYSCTVSLQYGALPDYLKVQNGDFGHSVTLYRWREDEEYVGFFDPLWPQGSDGSWAKWSDVRRAMWADGNHSTTVQIIGNVARWDGAVWDRYVWA